jgi:hypothetical protein
MCCVARLYPPTLRPAGKLDTSISRQIVSTERRQPDVCRFQALPMLVAVFRMNPWRSMFVVPRPNNDPNCLLEFDARYGSVVPGPAIVLRSCTSGYFVRSASRGSSASGSTPRPRQVCGPHCRPVVPVVDSDADVVTCNLRSAQALLFPGGVESCRLGRSPLHALCVAQTSLRKGLAHVSH